MDDAIYRAGQEMSAAESAAARGAGPGAEVVREPAPEVLRRLARSARRCDPFSAYEALELEAVAAELDGLRADGGRLERERDAILDLCVGGPTPKHRESWPDEYCVLLSRGRGRVYGSRETCIAAIRKSAGLDAAMSQGEEGAGHAG